jgi:cell division protein FtsL
MQTFHAFQHLSPSTCTSVALGCLFLAITILTTAIFVLYRARKNLQQSEKAMQHAQELESAWNGERHRFSRPTLRMPEDYYRGYEKVS